MRYLSAGKVKVDILFPVVFIISYLTGFIGQLFMAYLTVLIHEAAHAFTALAFGCSIKQVYLLAFGTRIEPEINLDSNIKKCMIFAAGPMVNIVAAILLCLIPADFMLREILIASNLCLAFFNLMPVLPLDGGEILSIYTVSRFGLFYSEKISRMAFLAITAVLLIISIPAALFWGNMSILILGLFLLGSYRKRGEAAFMNAKSLYYRRARLLRKGYYSVREVVILDRMTLGEAFKIMDFDQYHILIILDEDMKILNRYTESELLAAISEFGYGFTFKELNKKAQ